MVEDKLRIIVIYKSLLNDVYKAMINIPKEHYSLKELIINEMFNYLKELYLANDIIDKNVRIGLKEEAVIKFKYICSLIRILNENKILGEKRYLQISEKEKMILLLLNGWKKNEIFRV